MASTRSARMWISVTERSSSMEMALYLVCRDPMNEYFDIAETYGGTVVNMSTYTDNYVNPLEMDVWSLDPNDSKGMVREKGEFMLGLCEQCIRYSHWQLRKTI